MKKLIGMSILVLTLGACSNSDDENKQAIEPAASAAIEGVWKRATGDGKDFEGVYFAEDGKLGYINLYSMSGSDWQRDGEQITLGTLTENYPEGNTETLKIDKLDSNNLILTGDGYSAGSYTRDDEFGGVLRGELKLPTDGPLPADALLSIQLNDVGEADAASDLVGNRLIPVGGKSGSISWAVFYPNAKVKGASHYSRFAVSARLSYDGALQYQTTRHYPAFEMETQAVETLELESAREKSGHDSEPGTYISLTDTDWHLLEVVFKAIPDGADLSQATIKFSPDGKVHGSLGCNTFNGSYTLDGEALSFGPLMTTRKACVGDQGEIEAAMNAALAGVNGYQIYVKLLHLAKDGVPVLRFAPPVEEFMQGKWALESILGVGIPDDINPAEYVWLEFSGDGKVSGKTGCNTFSSSYELADKNLKFGPLMGTMMACAPDFMMIEKEMQRVLEQAVSYSYFGNIMDLHDTEGKSLASFKMID